MRVAEKTRKEMLLHYSLGTSHAGPEASDLSAFLRLQDFGIKKDLWAKWPLCANLVCTLLAHQVHLGDGHQSAPVLPGPEAKQSK